MRIPVICLLSFLAMVPTLTSAKSVQPNCLPTKPWMTALCFTLESQTCSGRCSGKPNTLDCSCKSDLYESSFV